MRVWQTQMSLLASGFYCGIDKSLLGNVLQLGGEVRFERDFRDHLME